MYCFIIVGLQDEEQLRRVAATTVEEVRAGLLKIASLSGGVSETDNRGPFCFFIDPPGALKVVADAALQMASFLGEHRLYGFSIYIVSGASSTGGGELLDSKAFCYHTWHENAIWVLGEAQRLFQDLLETRVSGPGRRVIGWREGQAPVVVESLDLFQVHEPFIETILQAVDPKDRTRDSCQVLQLCGPSHSGRWRTLQRALEVLEGDEVSFWLTVDPLPWPRLWRECLIRGLSPSFLEEVPLYLKEEKRVTWKSLEPLLQSFATGRDKNHSFDRFEIDFKKLLQLSLEAYSQKKRREKLPPLVIFRNFEQVDRKILSLVKSYIIPEVARNNLILVFSSLKESHWKEFSQLRTKILSFNPLSSGSVTAKLRECLPHLKFTKKKVAQILERTEGHPFKLFHGIYNHPGALQKDPIMGNLKNLQPLPLQILYVSFVTGGVLGEKLLLEFFSQEGIAEVKQYLILLRRLGFLGEEGEPRIEEYEAFVGGLIEKARPVLIRRLYAFLEKRRECIRGGSLEFFFALWRRHISCEDLRFFWRDLVVDLLERGELRMAVLYLEEGKKLGTLLKERLTLLERQEWSNLVEGVQTRLSLKQAERDQTFPFLLDQRPQEACERGLSREYLCAVARYFYTTGDAKRGTAFAKEALRQAQRESNYVASGEAYLLLALFAFTQRKLQMVRDYLEIVERVSAQVGDQIRLAQAKLIGVFLYYHLGNLSTVCRRLGGLTEQMWLLGRKGWYLLALVLEGRVRFELGQYKEAKKLFLRGYEESGYYEFFQPQQLCNAWLGRCLTYGGELEAGRVHLVRQPHTKEVLYFLSENAYLSSEIDQAVIWAQEAISIPAPSFSYFVEEEDWSDGFTLLEWRACSKIERYVAIENQILSFFLFLRGTLAEPEEAKERFRELLSSEEQNIRKLDIFKYYYLFGEIMEEQDPQRKQLFSRAYRLLQRAAGKFDDPRLKQSYLEKNYWNNRILQIVQSFS